MRGTKVQVKVYIQYTLWNNDQSSFNIKGARSLFTDLKRFSLNFSSIRSCEKVLMFL